jgi:hypothetical protein
MTKSRKKLIRLNEDDHQLIRKILIKIGIILYELINSRQSPDDFAKAQLKIFKKKHNLARLFTLYHTNLNVDKVITPKEMNRQITEFLVKESQDHQGDMTLDSVKSHKRMFISPNRMSEILTSLEASGLFLHIDSRKEMRNLMGRKKLNLEGRPSGYKLSLNATKVLSLLSKPEAIEIIVKSLEESKLIFCFIKHRITGFLYFVKYATRKDLENLFRSVSDNNTDKISEDIQFYLSIKPVLSSLDKLNIERIADQATIHSMRTICHDKRGFLTRLFVMLAATK